MPSLLQRLTSRGNAERRSAMTWRGRTNTRCIGIDLDMDSFRISVLGRSDARSSEPSDATDLSHLNWNTFNKISLPSFALTNGPIDIKSPKQLQLWLDELLELLPRSVDSYRNVVTISLPPSWTHYEMTREGESQSAIARCNAMFNESVFCSDAHMRSWPAGKHTDRMVLAAVSKQTALQLARAIRGLGYEVHGIYPQGIALASAARALTTLNPRCVVALGKHGGGVSMLACDLEGDQLTGLCRQLKSPSVNSTAGDPRALATLVEIEPWLDNVSQDIAATLAYANRLNGVWEDAYVDARPILVAGEMAAIAGIDAALAARIQKPVAVWRFASGNRPLSTTVVSPAVIDPTAAVSLSLAHMSATCPEGVHCR